MKKALKMLIPVLVLAMVFSISASAFSGINANEQKILDLLDSIKTVRIGQTEYKFNDAYRVRAFNVLNRDQTDLTAEEADEIIALIKSLIEDCKNYDIPSAKELTTDMKKNIETKVQKAADVVELKAGFDASQTVLKIVDKDVDISETVVEIVIEASDATKGDDNVKVVDLDPVIKPTGADNYTVVAIVSAALVLVACAFVLGKKRVHG